MTHEWGPVKLFHNESGRLREQTAQAGLSEHLGWWNGIAGRDLDNDGDIDYVVTNFGLNTKYHPSPQKPTMVYYGDLDDTGKMHIVEAAIKGGGPLPLHGRRICCTGTAFLALHLLRRRCLCCRDTALLLHRCCI